MIVTNYPATTRCAAAPGSGSHEGPPAHGRAEQLSAGELPLHAEEVLGGLGLGADGAAAGGGGGAGAPGSPERYRDEHDGVAAAKGVARGQGERHRLAGLDPAEQPLRPAIDQVDANEVDGGVVE